MSKTLNDEWRSYKHNVIPSGAAHIQKIECQRAFMAGALAFWNCMEKARDEGISRLEIVELLTKELDSFKEDVTLGRQIP